MNILVTGGSGKLGAAVVADLVAHGHDVVNADVVPPPTAQCPYLEVDLRDFGEVLEAISGVDLGRPSDAVVHLAATPAPGRRSNARTFQNNIVSTYNVFEACRRARVHNVVYASTEIIFGLPFPTPPAYLPLDEEAPARPESAYGLSKLLSEEMAKQFCRWEPELKCFGLRFSNVQSPEDYANFAGFQERPEERHWNLWGYIDARDGAKAVRLALECPLKGAEVFTIANAETTQSMASSELVGRCFPEVRLPDSLGENETLLSIDKARRVLGYEPDHHWWSEPG